MRGLRIMETLNSSGVSTPLLPRLTRNFPISPKSIDSPRCSPSVRHFTNPFRTSATSPSLAVERSAMRLHTPSKSIVPLTLAEAYNNLESGSAPAFKFFLGTNLYFTDIIVKVLKSEYSRLPLCGSTRQRYTGRYLPRERSDGYGSESLFFGDIVFFSSFVPVLKGAVFIILRMPERNGVRRMAEQTKRRQR